MIYEKIMRLIYLILVLTASLGSQPLKNDLSCAVWQENPLIGIWKQIRLALDDKNGDAYAEQINGAELPKFPATILAMNGDKYLGSVLDGKTADVVIRLTGPWKGKPLQVGTELIFEGTNEGVTRKPFRMMVAVDPVKVEVLEKSRREEGRIIRCYTEEEWKRVRAGEKVPPR